MLWVINVTRTKPAAPCDVTTQGCAVTDSKSQGFNIWRIRSRLDRTARKEILQSKLSLNRIKRANVGRLKSTVLRRSVALTWHNLGSTRFIGASNVAREVFWKRFPKFPRPENEPADQLYKSRRKCLLAESVASVYSAIFGFQPCECETCHTCVQASGTQGWELRVFASFPLMQC